MTALKPMEAVEAKGSKKFLPIFLFMALLFGNAASTDGYFYIFP